MKIIKVVLVDDQTLVRSGIRGLLDLSDDIRVVAEAADGDQALDVIAQAKPDVVLLDIRMPGRSGIDVLKALKDLGDMPPTILLTTFDDDEALLEGIRAGAKGFLLKDISLERLIEAIRCVAGGSTLIRPTITERILQGLKGTAPSFPNLDLPDRLTNRETEILRLMAGGFNNREIADALGTGEGTVKNHVSSILSKLGVRDRVRAVLRGLELGGICHERHAMDVGGDPVCHRLHFSGELVCNRAAADRAGCFGRADQAGNRSQAAGSTQLRSDGTRDAGGCQEADCSCSKNPAAARDGGVRQLRPRTKRTAHLCRVVLERQGVLRDRGIAWREASQLLV